MSLIKRNCLGTLLGVAYWALPSGSVLPVKIPIKNIERPQDVPPSDAGARFMIAIAVPELDTADGYATTNDCWEQRDPYVLDARLEELRNIEAESRWPPDIKAALADLGIPVIDKMDPALSAELKELSDPATLYRPTDQSVNILRVATSNDPGDYWRYKFEWAVRPSKDDADQTHRKVGFQYDSTGHRATLTQYDKADPSKAIPPPVVPAITKTDISGVITAGASPTWDATSTGQSAATIVTIAHTVAALSNMALYVSGGQDGIGSNTATATYNLVSMTLIEAVTATGNRLASFVLVAPPTGVADNIVFNGSALPLDVVGDSYSGVNQTTAYQNVVKNANGSATTVSDAVTSATGNTVLDCVNVNNEADSNILADTGQTKRGGIGGNGQAVAMSEAPGAASYTMAWHGWAAARVSHIAWDVPAVTASFQPTEEYWIDPVAPDLYPEMTTVFS